MLRVRRNHAHPKLTVQRKTLRKKFCKFKFSTDSTNPPNNLLQRRLVKMSKIMTRHKKSRKIQKPWKTRAKIMQGAL